MQDFFIRHRHQSGSVDWNFNILFDDQPQVGRMARKYKKALRHPAMHPPIPTQWLHMTILRVGYTTEFTDGEMSLVAGRLGEKLKALGMPELILGSSHYFNSCPVLIATPWTAVESVFDHVMTELRAVVGPRRMPRPGRFVPHVSLAYNRQYNLRQLREFRQRLSDHPVDPVRFRATSVSMIKQKQTPPFYRWKIVRDIAIGQGA